MSAPTSDGRPLAVFDLDGVLADVRHRLHHLEQQPKDWAAFFRAAVDDPVHPEGLALATEAAADCEVVYLTGRPEQCRRDTVTWLRQHGLPEGALTMRGPRDRRPARLAKPELLHALARGRVVAVVVDDDLEVCDAYEQAGWRVLRATWAVRSDTLVEAQEEAGRT
jgi:phosphoglycolate phosphatase-like HAD superfamily hydrolase